MGATSLSYLLTRGDEGSVFTIHVGATNTSGTTVANAKPTGPVASLLPVNLSRPVIKGPSIQQSVQLGITGYDWQSTPDTVFADAWLRCGADGSSCQPIGGAASGIYTPSAADVGHTLVVVVTATNLDGSVNAASDPTTIVLPAGPRWRSLPKVAAAGASVGDPVSITPGTWSGPAIGNDLIEMMRCTNTCTPVGQPHPDSYTIADADIGAILRVRETASNAGGSTIVWSSRYVGPVSSPAAASAVLAVGQQPLRNSQGVMLATAQLTSTASPGAFTANTPARTIKLRRAGAVKGTLKAWVCPVASATSGVPRACTAQVALRASASVRIPASMTGKLRVVVVRRGR